MRGLGGVEDVDIGTEVAPLPGADGQNVEG
jgi:hypothetical protein